MMYVIGPDTAVRGSWPTPISRARTARSIRTSGRTREGMRGSSGSSPSRAGSRATSRPRRPGSIHEGGELGYSLLHAYGAAFDNPDLIVACVVGDGEAETGRCDQLALEQVPESGARRRGAADPAPERLQDRQPDRAGAHPRRGADALFDGYGYEPYFVEGDDPATMHAADGRHARHDFRRDSRHPAAARAAAGRRRAALAADRAAHAEGMDRPEGGRRQAGRRARGARTRCRSPSCATIPSTCDTSKNGCGAIGPKSCSTTTASCSPSWRARADGRPAHGRQSACERRPPAARPACCRTSASYAVAVRARRGRCAKPRACSALSRDVMRLNLISGISPRRPRQDRLEPPGSRARATTGPGEAKCCLRTSASPRLAA